MLQLTGVGSLVSGSSFARGKRTHIMETACCGEWCTIMGNSPSLTWTYRTCGECTLQRRCTRVCVCACACMIAQNLPIYRMMAIFAMYDWRFALSYYVYPHFESMVFFGLIRYNFSRLTCSFVPLFNVPSLSPRVVHLYRFCSEIYTEKLHVAHFR